MKTIEIITTSDIQDCDTCGSNWAEGGYVIIDGVEVLRVTPEASCFGGLGASESELLLLALSAVGVSVRVDGYKPYVMHNELGEKLL